MINKKTPKEKIAEWQLQNRMRSNFEVKLASQLKTEFVRTYKTISNDYLISGRQSLDIESRPHYNRVKSIIFSHWKSVTTVFRARILSLLRLVQETERKEYEDEFDKEFENFLFTFGAEKVSNISSTTIADIRNAINVAQVDGLDFYQTAKKIT